MKKILFYAAFLIALGAGFSGCNDDNSYPGARISPYIPLYDLRSLYKGEDLTLTTEKMFGSNSIAAVVVSDHTGGNLPQGLLVVQDKRRIQQLRGISIPIGDEAKNYMPGDSVIVKVEGGVLKRLDGILQITNIPASAITKVASNVPIPSNRVTSSAILADPDRYESTLVAIVKGMLDPLPQPTDVYAGDKKVNDGFDDITMHTLSTANFANKNNIPIMGNYYGIIFNTVNEEGKLVPQHRIRTDQDIVPLSSTIEIAPIIITGFMSDAKGSDANNEYIQLMATKDINFATTPFSVVTTNNAGTATPSGFPTKSWAMGGVRTYKMNLTSGTAAKGTFFYVGGSNKLINGAPGGVKSTDISSSNWIKAYDYNGKNGEGFGTKTGNLLANSGNAFGIAVFQGTTVTETSKPVDVIFVRNGGNIFTAGPPAAGYRITNTDFYDVVDPMTLQNQPFYNQGSNTLFFNYLTGDMGYFNKLGGVYNPALGRWVKARRQTGVLLTVESTIQEIEGTYPIDPETGEGAESTRLK